MLKWTCFLHGLYVLLVTSAFNPIIMEHNGWYHRRESWTEHWKCAYMIKLACAKKGVCGWWSETDFGSPGSRGAKVHKWTHGGKGVQSSMNIWTGWNNMSHKHNWPPWKSGFCLKY